MSHWANHIPFALVALICLTAILDRPLRATRFWWVLVVLAGSCVVMAFGLVWWVLFEVYR